MKKKTDRITEDMDEFASNLLTAAKEAENLPDKVLAFKEVGRWMLIKHRLDPDGDGDGLDDLKSKLKDHSSGGAGFAAEVGPRPGSPGHRYTHPEGDGSGLDAVRAMILGRDSRNDDGGLLSPGPDIVSQTAPPAFARRSRLFGELNNDRPEPVAADDGGDV